MNKPCQGCEAPNLSQEHLIKQLELAWGLIANAMDYYSEINEEWLQAAKRWRDDYHVILDDYCKNNQESPVNAPLPVYHCNHCNHEFVTRASSPYGELGCPQCYSDNLYRYPDR